MNKSITRIAKLALYFENKYFSAKAQQNNDNDSWEDIEPRPEPLGINPNVEGDIRGNIPGHFEIFKKVKEILPEFVQISPEQQAQIIKELEKLKKKPA